MLENPYIRANPIKTVYLCREKIKKRWNKSLIFVSLICLTGLCNPIKIEKMANTATSQAVGMVKAMIPVALGVAAGMLIYEQVKKATAKANA
jgi:hypothetical protein